MPDGAPAAARSWLGASWRLREADPARVQRIATLGGVPEIVARVLDARGIAPEDAVRFLNPRLAEQLPDPSHLLDMDRAAARLVRAIAAGETIAIFGDYDVDGATSAALLRRFLQAVGARVRVYIPDRLSEGYGPNAPALRRLVAEGARVVVTVDCGIGAHAALAEGAAAGLDIVVVDHHGAAETLPPGHAIVNPNRRDETSPLGHLAAVGLAFLLAVAVNRALRAQGWYRTRPEPDLLALLDLVALGTVADIVPLSGLNRVFVAQGLKVLNGRTNPGIAALAQVARLNGAIDAYHLGFVLGPRVNAGGRVGAADLGARILATDDPDEAAALAAKLDALNRERQAIEAEVLDQAAAQVAADDGPVALAIGAGWHAGVIGIVASRLRERFNRPAIVIAHDGAIGKGSGRTNDGVDLGAVIRGAREAGLLIDGGGHPRAAGLTVEVAKLDALRRFLTAALADAPRGAPVLEIDAGLSLAACTPELAAQLERAGPYGAGHREPRLLLRSVQAAFADVVGEKHVRCSLTDLSGARVQAIAFRALGSRLGDGLLDRTGAAIDVAGVLRADEWQGRVRAQFRIEDAAPA
jgi:single-stranded-DNA-specific exonuclease